MKILSITEITVRSRQRKSMDRAKLDELKRDIMGRGLLHAPVIRWQPTTASAATFEPVLVAGERRLTAIRELAAEGISFLYDRENISLGCIPCIELEDKGDIANREAELNENVLREDLSWQDKVAAINELHQLRLAINPEQTKRATGVEIANATGLSVDRSRVLVDRATIVADHLHDPDVQRASSADEAFKVVSRKLEAKFNAGLAAGTQSQVSDHTLIQGDMRVELMRFPWGPGDKYPCIIFDPPYGVGADTFGDAAELKHQYDDTPAAARDLMRLFFQASKLFAAENAHAYIFCDIDQFVWLRETAETWGWKPMRTPLIWVKGANQGHVPDQSIGWRRTHEAILFAVKGTKPLAHIANDTIPFPADSDKLHAAQKPVALYQHLLSLSCLPGDRVLDPCCGSGTIFKAAHVLRLRATGIELNEQYADFSRAAIASLKPLAAATAPASLATI
jgi:hypothetical protein